MTELRKPGLNASNSPFMFADASALQRFSEDFREGIGAKIDYRMEVDSTQDAVREAAVRGERHGFVCIAENQTAGRGRRGRSWDAAPCSSLLFSVLLRGFPGSAAGWVGLAAAYATARALRVAAAVDVRVKWPNDVVAVNVREKQDGLPPLRAWDAARPGREIGGADGRGSGPNGICAKDDAAADSRRDSAKGLVPKFGMKPRKIAGVLVEATWGEGGIAYAILGIGINVLQSADLLPAKPRMPATSVLLETGRKADRLALFREALFSLKASLDPLRSGGAAWEAERDRIRREMNAWWNGARLELKRHGGANLRGTYAGLTDSGSIVLNDASGETVVVSEAEEVNLCDT